MPSISISLEPCERYLKEDGMIWLHANFTDIEIGQNLIERGVDPRHIEISWIEPALRRLVEAAKKGG